MAGAGRVARGGRHPRRGRPPGPAARSHLRSSARRGAEALSVMTTEIEVLDDPARACAAMLVGAAAGGGHVVLTGGSTPRVAYEELVKAVKAVDLDLTQSTFWFGDDRCVPPEDERSNYRLAKESLIDPLGPENQPIVWRMKGELGPHEGADDYQRTLQEAGPPRFELVLLGIGPDGHCA